MRNPAIQISLALCACVVLFTTSCKKDDTDNDDVTKYTITPGATAQEDAQTAMIEMTNGDTIYFNGASFDFTNTLSVDGKDNIVIMGNGRLQTSLSFAGQTSGGEGLKVNNSNNVILEHFTVADAAGDAIKTKDCDGLVFRYVGAVWSGTPNEDNGAYGLYPVLCQNVLIDSCYVFGASDAGIYVGQTTFAIVRNSIATGNVAGIEIENTISADVYNNHAYGNTGGILVFDLPGLTQAGQKTRVFDNLVENNSRANFAPAGNIVASVPPGTGIMVLSTKQVEVFNNTITNNNVLGLGVVSYLMLDTTSNASYNPYPSYVDVHDNIFTRTSDLPDTLNTIATLITANFPADSIPDILLDGYFDPSIADTTGTICIRNNGSAKFVNIDAKHVFANPSFDISVHDCTHGALPVVTVDTP